MAKERNPSQTPAPWRWLRLPLLLLTACISWLLFSGKGRHGFEPGLPPATKKAQVAAEREARPPLPGELILRDYGSASVRPENDLTMVAMALGNLTLLIKGPEPFRLGSNEEFAAALRGKNHAQLRFLPDDHRAFNAKGQIVDRWDTPLFFHALGHDKIDIRSAGPDRVMWTDDDIQRRYDGQFLKGKDLK